jgi:hypothetical protein
MPTNQELQLQRLEDAVIHLSNIIVRRSGAFEFDADETVAREGTLFNAWAETVRDLRSGG